MLYSFEPVLISLYSEHCVFVKTEYPGVFTKLSL